MSKLLKDGIIILDGRLSYPHLWVAQAVKGESEDKARYSASILLPKEDTKAKAIIDGEIRRLAKEKMKGVLPKGKDISMKDGDGEEGDQFSAGCWKISANRYPTQGRPAVLDRGLNPLTADDGKPYAGCWCRFKIGVYVPKAWPSKICFSLEAVQFMKDDEPFGAGAPTAEGFEELPEDDDDDII